MNQKKTLDDIYRVLAARQSALRKALQGDLSLLNELREQKAYDFVDAAFISAGNEINSQLAEVVSQELTDIECALDRMCEGGFGVCEECGLEISVSRLNALPYATRCLRCQRWAESKEAIASYERMLVEASGSEFVLDDI